MTKCDIRLCLEAVGLMTGLLLLCTVFVISSDSSDLVGRAQSAEPVDAPTSISKFDAPLRYDALNLFHLPQTDTCLVVWQGGKSGGMTEVACSDDFVKLAREARFPESQE